MSPRIIRMAAAASAALGPETSSIRMTRQPLPTPINVPQWRQVPALEEGAAPQFVQR
jgi:hypothetical protein